MKKSKPSDLIKTLNTLTVSEAITYMESEKYLESLTGFYACKPHNKPVCAALNGYLREDCIKCGQSIWVKNPMIKHEVKK